MIRRDWPLTDNPGHWLLIPQEEHARLSEKLAAAWRLPGIGDLFEGTRTNPEEVVQAIRLHDRGWRDWDAAPGIDPSHARPYGFTEMPPQDAQRIWTESIHACRELGPLAGWMAAGHFIHLQSKQDEDDPAWRSWLERHERLREEWLAEWLHQDARHTERLANHALLLLQAFDWISLWICCRAPLTSGDPEEGMDLADARFGFGPFRCTATLAGVSVAPWPLGRLPEGLELSVDAMIAPVRAYRGADELLESATPGRYTWTLAAPRS